MTHWGGSVSAIISGVCVHACAHTHMHKYTHVSVYTLVHIHVYSWTCESQRTAPSVVPRASSTLNFLWQDALLSRLDQLSSKSQASSCPCFFSAVQKLQNWHYHIELGAGSNPCPHVCTTSTLLTEIIPQLSPYFLSVCAHMWEGQRSVLSDIPLLVSTLCFETGSLTETGAHPCNCTKWSAMLRAVSLPPQHWGCRSTAPPGFYMILNSNSCLLTWLSS